MQHHSRRRVLQLGSLAAVGAIAGCSTLLGEDDSEDLTFERLQETALYLDDDVDLSVPEEVQTVDATNNADLLVLPGDTDVGAEQAVDWLAAERILALLGDDAESTWLAWKRSDAYQDTFDGRGFADSEPDPYLLVAAPVDTRVTTYNYSWGDGPRDRDVLRKLDETLVAIANRTTARRIDDRKHYD